MSTHRFSFTKPYLLAGLPFGVTPRTTSVEVADGELAIRFGLWRLRTPVANVADCTVTGPYGLVKTAGPPRLSLADRGITFATNGARGLCVRFHEPVPAIDPCGRIRHPSATLTVERPSHLADHLAVA